jgi:cytochrome c553
MEVEEVHNIIKTLNGIKFTEQFGNQNNVLSKLSDEQVRIIAGWLEGETTSNGGTQ